MNPFGRNTPATGGSSRSPRVTIRRLLLAGLVPALICAGVFGGVALASGESTGSITGKVTAAATSSPVAGATVCAAGSAGLGCATTNEAGEYTITGLGTGAYTVLFSSSGNYLSQYYNGKATASEATPVAVTNGAATSAINAALQPGGQITGKVTDAATKIGIVGVSVCAAGSAGLRCATTGAGGEYTVVGLATGEYTVLFSSSGNYLSQYYNGKATAAEANPVSVTAGATTSAINAAMHPGGQITGKVTDAFTGDPISGASVCAAGSAGLRCAATNSTGKYTVKGLATGEYTVLFSSSGNYLSQYYNGKATAAEATPVSITAGSTAKEIDAALQPGGKITGKVTDVSTSKAVVEATVCAAGTAGVACDTTNSSGEYTITGLASGEYTVKFSATTYAPQYYDGAVGAAEATPVFVTAGSTSSGINAALALGGQIAGKVTDVVSTNAALVGALVCASNNSGLGCATTNASGEYTITGLAAGEYTVKFSAAMYISQYYNGRSSAAEAAQVPVAAGGTAAGINAALQVGGQITGKVTDVSTSAALAGVLVCASNSAGGGCGVTNEAGQYTITSLATGEYTVKFSSANYVPQYYAGKLEASEATPVAVTAGATTAGIGAALEVGGQITGKVLDSATKKPIAGTLVCASDGALGACGVANEAGEYAITGLASGQYTVKFAASNYVPQYYNGKAGAAEATPVPVTARETTTGINATLQVGGKITGTVIDAFSKKAVAGAVVCATPSVGLGCATTNGAGEYTITGLATGDYTVKFSAATFVSQYYNGKADESEATPVSVKAGASKSGVNATLQPSGQITGKVTDVSTTNPIAGTKVCAAGTSGEACALTNEAGEYAITGLDSGEYTVKFLASTYVLQYYSGKARPSEATPVAIKAGGTTGGINAALQRGGQITGKVTDASTKKAVAGATVCTSPSGGFGCVTTNSSGEYAVTGLASGEYKVKFSANGYATQYYNGKATVAEATGVSVTVATTTPGINAALLPSGQITGKVTDAVAKKGIGGATVCVTGAGEGCASTNAAGEYTITGVGSGEYKVKFSAGGYFTQYYNGKASESEATPVMVKAGATTSGIGAALQPEPAYEVEVLERLAGEGYSEGPLTGKAPLKVEYEVILTNTGSVPVAVEGIGDPQVMGCTTASPKKPEVKAGESDVVEAVCSHTIGGEGETFKNVATVKASGKEQATEEVEAKTESVPRFEPEVLEREAGQAAYTKGPLTGPAPMTVEYEILVTNRGLVELTVEQVRDLAAPGCEKPPMQPTVKVGESKVVEAKCNVIIAGEGEVVRNRASVRASNSEAGTGQVQAETEEAPVVTPPPEETGGPPPNGGGGSGGGSPSTGGSVLGSQSTTLTKAQVLAALGHGLLPAAKARKIATVLKSGGLALQVRALEAGTLQVTWYELPPGAKLAKKAAPKPVVVATGRASVPVGGSVKVKMTLTSAGKTLLKHAKRLAVTVRGTFTPTGGTAVTSTGSFVLTR